MGCPVSREVPQISLCFEEGVGRLSGFQELGPLREKTPPRFRPGHRTEAQALTAEAEGP